MKTITKSLILLTAILLMASCKNKGSKHTLAVTTTDTAVVYTPKFVLTDVMVPSLAKELETLITHLDTMTEGMGSEPPDVEDGEGHIFLVYFYNEKKNDLVRVVYHNRYWESIHLPLRRPQSGETREDVMKDNYIIPMDGHILYKDILFGFYNLPNQGSAGSLVDSTQLQKGNLERFRSFEQELAEGVMCFDCPRWGKILKIHSKDSLELLHFGRTDMY